jgi:hypothetical protein
MDTHNANPASGYQKGSNTDEQVQSEADHNTMKDSL